LASTPPPTRTQYPHLACLLYLREATRLGARWIGERFYRLFGHRVPHFQSLRPDPDVLPPLPLNVLTVHPNSRPLIGRRNVEIKFSLCTETDSSHSIFCVRLLGSLLTHPASPQSSFHLPSRAPVQANVPRSAGVVKVFFSIFLPLVPPLVNIMESVMQVAFFFGVAPYSRHACPFLEHPGPYPYGLRPHSCFGL